MTDRRQPLKLYTVCAAGVPKQTLVPLDDRIQRVSGCRFIAIVASFLVFSVLADISRTGLCDDTDGILVTLLKHDALSRPAPSHSSSCCQTCFCCAVTVEPHRPFEIEALRSEKSPVTHAATSVRSGLLSPVYHPPKVG